MIAGRHQVEAYFGYWPEFCDGRIVGFSYSRPAELRLVVSYSDVENGKRAEVHLRFLGARELELENLRTENVLDALRIVEGSRTVVTLEGCYGLDGSFTCDGVEVVSVCPT